MKEFLPAKNLKFLESVLEAAPIGNSLFEPKVLLLGQGNAGGFAFDLTAPLIARPAGTGAAVLHKALADPTDVAELPD